MYLLRYVLLIPLLESSGITSQFGSIYFSLLVIACILTAAAGYIINDIYDVDIDNVNRPDKVIIGRTIRLRTAENIYITLIIAAVVLGVYISYGIGLRSLSLLIPIVSGLLYFYATSYKGQFFVGNLIVAIFSALIPATVLLFELPLLKIKYVAFITNSSFNFNFLIAWFGYYSLFAFLISLLREIIKDIEDFEGDTAYGKKTWPVTYGIKISKIVALLVLIVVIFLQLFIGYKYLNNFISMLYILIFILIPSLYAGFVIINAKEKKDYTNVSKLIKALMLAGICYLIVFRVFILR
jgi:4-hydroxybenzoate polyprenyltransferase